MKKQIMEKMKKMKKEIIENVVARKDKLIN